MCVDISCVVVSEKIPLIAFADARDTCGDGWQRRLVRMGMVDARSQVEVGVRWERRIVVRFWN